MKNATKIKSRFKGYCNTCQFTIFKGEEIWFNGLAHHLNCDVALCDKYPRHLNPAYKILVGQVDRKRMRQLIHQRAALKG